MNEETIDTIEENLEDIPEEVKDFIFGEELQSIKQELAPNFSDKAEQLQIENNIELFLLESISFEELADSINNLSVPEEKKMVIKTIIQEKIIDEIHLLVQVHKEMSGDKTMAPPDAPTPSDMIARLNQTLTQSTTPTTFTPTKRVYSAAPLASQVVVPPTPPIKPSVEPEPIQPVISPKPVEAPSMPHIEKGGIDPYRELPKE